MAKVVEDGAPLFILEKNGEVLGEDLQYHKGVRAIRVSPGFLEGVREGIFVPGEPTDIREVTLQDGKEMISDRQPFWPR